MTPTGLNQQFLTFKSIKGKIVQIPFSIINEYAKNY